VCCVRLVSRVGLRRGRRAMPATCAMVAMRVCVVAVRGLVFGLVFVRVWL